MESFISLEGLSNLQLLGLTALIVWTLIWKGIALWRSSKNEDKYWFIAMLVLNTVGILEIIYILFFGKKEVENNEQNEVSGDEKAL